VENHTKTDNGKKAIEKLFDYKHSSIHAKWGKPINDVTLQGSEGFTKYLNISAFYQ
jgi:hypothetical protein